MFDLLATAISWFYELWPSFGVAIVMLTIAILLLVTPLTLKGTRSMLELQIHQPELRRIQQQYRDDRQRMNEEMMKFYQEHKINPVGGCLPLLIQAPVFIILYNVIRGLTQRTDLLGSLLQTGDASLTGTFNPKYLDHSSELFQRLSESKHMFSWGIDLSQSAVHALGQSFGQGLPYIALIAGATATSYYQQRQIQGRATSQVNPQMQAITRIMPLFITFISLTLPAALVVYFFASGCYRIGQQAIITRHIYHPNKERLAAASATAPQGGGSTGGAGGGKGGGGGGKGSGGKGGGGGGKAATVVEDAPAPGGFLGRLLGPPAAPPPAPPKGGSTKNAQRTTGSKSGRASGNGSNGASKTTPTPRPSGRATPPGSIGNRPAASRKKKRK